MVRRIVLIAAALLIAATATWLTQRWLSNRLAGSAVVAAPASVNVLVAARTLETGTVVRRGALRWARWPVDSSIGLLTASNARIETFDGAVVRFTMGAGEPVVAARLVQPGTRGPLAAVINPGQRAVTISVNPASGMAGFVVPGDRIDLLLTQVLPGSDGIAERHVSQTVLHDLRVLGTDQQGAGESGSEVTTSALEASDGAALLGSVPDRKGATPPTTVTLEVSPKGAEIIAVAAELGRLSLSLRSLVAGISASPGPTWDIDATQRLPRAVAVAAPPPAAIPVVERATTSARLIASEGIVVRGIVASAGSDSSRSEGSR